MNIKDAYLLPWRMTQKGIGWIELAFFVLALIVATFLAIFSHEPHLWMDLAALSGVALALILPLSMNAAVLLSVDAHQLRLPGVQREAVVGVWLNVLVAALLPTLVLGGLFDHTLAIAVIIAVLVVSGLLYGLLPRMVGMVFYLAFVATLSGGLWHRWLITMDSHDLDVAWLALAVGVMLVMLFWRRLVRASDPQKLSWHSPMVLRLWRGPGAAAGRAGGSQIHRRPDWLQARGDLRRCGPGHPVTSLRMALGDPYMPLTAMGKLRRYGVLVGTVALVGAWVVFVVVSDGESLARIWSGDGLVVLLLAGAGGIVMTSLLCLTSLTIRWSRTNAELPLLALLPQLGHDVKGNLLRAALLPPVRKLLLAAALVLAVLPRMGLRRDMSVLLLVIGTAGFVAVFGLRILSHCQLQRCEARAAVILGFVLFVGTFISGEWAIDPHGDASVMNLVWTMLLAGWTVLAVMLCRLGRRAWQVFARRPHPFLVR